MFGLWRRRSCHPHTRVALSLLQLGYLEKAQVRGEGGRFIRGTGRGCVCLCVRVFLVVGAVVCGPAPPFSWRCAT